MTFPNSTGHIKDREILHDYFQALKLLDKPPRIICEFGIDGGGQGGSLLLFNDFFAPDRIIGFDLTPCDFSNTKYPIECRWFNQMDPDSVRKAAAEYDYITDLFIDDCAHIKSGIIDTVYAFWPKLRSGGLYVIEDLLTGSDETRDFYANISHYFTDLDAEVVSYPTIVVLRKR